MIIAISGGVGSGKSVTAVKYAVDSMNRNIPVLTNFELRKVSSNYIRLKKDDVITKVNEINEQTNKPVIKKVVNWEFWNNHRNSDIFLDEVHNLISSRNSMSKDNRLYSEWISQIRKIWGSEGDQNYLEYLRKMSNSAFTKLWPLILAKSRNIYYISQKMRKADINFRELTHCLIQCEKYKINNRVLIVNNVWFGDDDYSAFEYAEAGQKPKKTIFWANDYFKYYDSYELISISGSEYL